MNDCDLISRIASLVEAGYEIKKGRRSLYKRERYEEFVLLNFDVKGDLNHEEERVFLDLGDAVFNFVATTEPS